MSRCVSGMPVHLLRFEMSTCLARLLLYEQDQGVCCPGSQIITLFSSGTSNGAAAARGSTTSHLESYNTCSNRIAPWRGLGSTQVRHIIMSPIDLLVPGLQLDSLKWNKLSTPVWYVENTMMHCGEQCWSRSCTGNFDRWTNRRGSVPFSYPDLIIKLVFEVRILVL